ncbi:MAG: GIY-YIG nuclease family protein [Candidatus Kerfeldbacteria bacterium]
MSGLSGTTMYSAYIIQSTVDGRFYIGCTNDVHRRIHEHNSGYSRYTKPYVPWKLVFEKRCATLSEAKRLERTIKMKKSRISIQHYIMRP